MWEDNSYCWVVMCKNNWFHNRVNLFSRHKIPLAETDVYAGPPSLKGTFTVTCDECHKEYLYKPSDVLRHDQELPASFIPHPLFQTDFMPRAAELAVPDVIEMVKGAERRRSERLFLDVSLIARGESAKRKAFLEPVFTTSVSAHGALVVMTTELALGQTLFLKDPRSQKEMEVRVARFGPPHGGLAQVGVDFTKPTLTFWPAVFPPKNWKSIAAQSRTAS